MEIIALQQYTDKHVSLYQGEIRNINTELAQRLIEKGIIKQHNQNDQESSDNKAFRIKVTVAGTFPNITSATADKTFQEVLDAYNAGKSIVVQVEFNGESSPLIEAAPISYTNYMGGVFAWSVVPYLNDTAIIVKFSYSEYGLYLSKVNITITQYPEPTPKEPKNVYVTRSGIVTDTSDLKSVAEVTEFIADNYELSPKSGTASGYEAVIKSGGVAINFYASNTPCRTDHLVVRGSSMSEDPLTITNIMINFSSTSDSDYGIRVAMPDFDSSGATIYIYDDTE